MRMAWLWQFRAAWSQDPQSLRSFGPTWLTSHRIKRRLSIARLQNNDEPLVAVAFGVSRHCSRR